MEENKRSKGYKEIFEEKYPAGDLIESSYRAAEALGYLKCLKEFMPSEKWIDISIGNILSSLLLKALFTEEN